MMIDSHSHEFSPNNTMREILSDFEELHQPSDNTVPSWWNACNRCYYSGFLYTVRPCYYVLGNIDEAK